MTWLIEAYQPEVESLDEGWFDKILEKFKISYCYLA